MKSYTKIITFIYIVIVIGIESLIAYIDIL